MVSLTSATRSSPRVHGNPHPPLLACISPNHAYYSLVTGDQRLRVYSTSNNLLTHEFISDHHLTVKYTALAWSNDSTFLVLGDDTGRVCKYTLSSSSAQATTLHTARINSLVFGEESTMYSCSEDGNVFAWKRDLSTSIKLYKQKHPVKTMAFVYIEGVPHLITASTTISLLTLPQGTVVRQFQGHATHVRQLVGYGTWLFSLAEEERFINVWNLLNGELLTSLVMESQPVQLSVMSHLINIVNDQGITFLWNTSSCKKKKPRKAECVLRLISGEYHLPIQRAVVHEDGMVQLRVIYGSHLRPVHEVISLELIRENDNWSFPTDSFTLFRDYPTNLLSEGFVDHPKFTDVQVYSNQKGSVITPFPPLSSIHMDASMSTQTDSPTLAEQLYEMNLQRETHVHTDCSAPTSVPVPPKPTSLVTLITQALHSRDHALLEQALRVTNTQVIRATLHRLNARYIPTLFIEIITRFESRPNRAFSLLPWISTLLTEYSTLIMSHPELSTYLSALYALMDTRLSAFPRLLALQGRVNMILGANKQNSLYTKMDEASVTFKEEEYSSGSEIDAIGDMDNIMDETFIESRKDSDEETRESFKPHEIDNDEYESLEVEDEDEDE